MKSIWALRQTKERRFEIAVLISVGDCKSPLLDAARLSKTNSMYIWRKRITPDWLEQRSEDLLRRFGNALAIIEQPGKARTLVEVSFGTRNEALKIQRELGGTIEKLRADWLEQLAKRNRTKPLRIGSRLIVSQTRAPRTTTARTIVIPAEAAFGTGEHATTAMCLRILERITRTRIASWSMLDAGTGSGILAIAASCLGAKKVIAIENDPLACAVAKRNAEANAIHTIEFRCGDVLKQSYPGKFNIITANLFSEILFQALPLWSRRVASDSCLILSGVLRSQEETFVAALQRYGFAVRETKRQGKWIALLSHRRKKAN
jgi:ribosomal protein L11 methyltransferase